MERGSKALQASWEKMGREEPFWSVITSPEFRSDVMTDQAKEEFYESGAAEVRTMLDFLRRADVNLPQGSCVDYGAGAGRVSIHLAEHFDKVIAADMSRPHLDQAKARAEALGLLNLRTLPVSPTGEELAHLFGQVALVHSIIALQHSQPNVTKGALATIGRLLREGGVAFFQVPTFHPAYDFETAVLGGKPFDSPMELHAVRQRDVFAIMYREGCVPVGVFEYDRVGACWDNRYFIFQKA